MMDATEVAAAELLLQNADFPDHYVDMQHPDDYSAVDQPFVEYITNSYAHHYRLIVRICWKLGEQKYLPMSFVCDTGAPTALYLSDKAYRMLSRHKRVQRMTRATCMPSYVKRVQRQLNRRHPVMLRQT